MTSTTASDMASGAAAAGSVPATPDLQTLTKSMAAFSDCIKAAAAVSFSCRADRRSWDAKRLPLRDGTALATVGDEAEAAGPAQDADGAGEEEVPEPREDWNLLSGFGSENFHGESIQNTKVVCTEWMDFHISICAVVPNLYI